ncbi:4-hydroxyphenylacetate 3-hydroxylase [Oceanobacillus piezotolerans]|uniref:4-hydroxyphenylacetate 3-hydroxylase n=1 Tax=Oceanobacillus piezotolerans TaxID=2448030 RepID=A0A498DBW6_9BACI|nr:4-hydroxyphenylacetate 3-hydroxylase N-terminal domain-containing protein [Oceanobacillus piezotolerans]RLL47058.1 4-hydroxyphenylacetate 3-hydroxylase [Oceanobacillus piezotolerans]
MSIINGAENIWLDGKRVPNPAEHEAFKGTFQTISKLIQLIDHDEVGFDDVSVQRKVHKAFLIPKSLEDLRSQRQAYDTWAGHTFGMMSRLSDYAYSLITGYIIDREKFNAYDSTFSEKITAYFEEVKRERRLITTAISDPQIDRSKPITERPEHALLHVVEENGAGIYVSGAKMIATGAPYVDDILINTPYPHEEGQKKYANFFIISTRSPGLRIICRKSHAEKDKELYPIASQFDEMDAVVLFDRVFIPNERIFIRGNAAGVTAAHRHQQLNALAHYQTVVRLAKKLTFIAGVTTAIAKSIAADSFLHVQQKLGELYMQVDTINGLLKAAEVEGTVHSNGVYYPNAVPLQVARNLGTSYYRRAMSILKDIGAGGFTQLPSTAIDRFEEEKLQSLMTQYYAGATVSAMQKTKLFRLGWELIGSEIGSRHDLYERFYTGDPLRIQGLFFEQFDKTPYEERLQGFLQKIQNPIYEGVNI